MINVPEDLRLRLVEHWNFGQFAEDFNQPLAKTIRKDLRELCALLAAHKEEQHDSIDVEALLTRLDARSSNEKWPYLPSECTKAPDKDCGDAATVIRELLKRNVSKRGEQDDPNQGG